MNCNLESREKQGRVAREQQSSEANEARGMRCSSEDANGGAAATAALQSQQHEHNGEGDGSDEAKSGLSAFSILLIILVVLALATVVMALLNVNGVESATIADVVTAPIMGFADALPVCLFVLVLGGFLGVISETGALNAGVGALVAKLNGKERWLIPILMTVFSIGGTTYGMWEETVPFCLLLAATMVAAGYDSLTGVAIVLVGAGCGVAGSTVNPFAVGVAVDAISATGISVNQAEIIALGAISWLICLAIGAAFVMRYAETVRRTPSASLMSDAERRSMESEFGTAGTQSQSSAASAHRSGEVDGAQATMTSKQKWALIVFAITFVVMIIGFIPWEEFGVDIFGWSAFLTGLPLGEWYFDEASAWFLLMAMIIGFVVWMREAAFVKAFLDGAADMISVVLIIAVARSVTVLMGETGLDIWLLDQAANALSGVSSLIFAPLAMLVFMGLSVLIPSSSGLATVSMPIMAPLADHLGLSVETTIMLFVVASGMVNLITPTSGALVGGLALAKLQYGTWVKFFVKVFVVMAVACLVALTIAMMLLSA